MALLWRLDRPGTPGPSYLFGTMHVRDARAFRRREQVYACLAECAAFATEFDLRELEAGSDPDALYLPDGQRLSTLLGERHYARLRRTLRRAFGVDLARFDRLRPLVVANLVGEKTLAEQYTLSLDEHLWQRAEATGMTTLGLETYASQRELLRGLPLAAQLRSLRAIGRHPAKFRRQIQRLADYYAAGQLDQLYRATRRGTGGMRHAMIFARNARMAARFDELARDQPLFAAVGAAHLPGGKGMLRLLKQGGWRTEPVRPSPA